MDGPFEMRVTRTTPTTYTLDCVERTRESELISHTASVELLQVIHEAENAAGTVLAVCDANQWKSRDIDTLRTFLSRSTARMRH